MSEEVTDNTSVPSSDLIQDKRRLRAEVLGRRDALGQTERQNIDGRIRERLQALPEYEQAAVVFSYVSVGSEIDTTLLIEEMLLAGKIVCTPRCLAGGIMHAHRITGLDELEEGAMSIPAPKADAPVVEPAAIDLALVPCLLSTRDGYRLGYGGGFYDRYLPQATNAAQVILCREDFLSEAVPVESHDVAVDMVVTENEVIVTSEN